MTETPIRPATPRDHAAIDDVVRRAFRGEDEVRLVAALRADGDVVDEFVAARDGAVVGHVLFSRLAIETPRGSLAAAALAPLAVSPAFQRTGIGSRLVADGLASLREAGCPTVVVLGHPGFYPRFGFDAARAARLAAPFSGPAFMALELVPGALAAGGRVRYARAFALDPPPEDPPR